MIVTFKSKGIQNRVAADFYAIRCLINHLVAYLTRISFIHTHELTRALVRPFTFTILILNIEFPQILVNQSRHICL